MQRNSLVALIVTGALAAVSVAVLRSPPAAEPRIIFTELGYSTTNRTAYTEAADGHVRADADGPTVRFTTGQPTAGATFQRFTNVLLADVRMHNNGGFAIVYESQSDIPPYHARLLGSNVTTTCTYHRYSGGPAVLEPGQSVEFRVWLPPDVQRWQVGFPCGRAGWWRAFGWRHWRTLGRLPEAVLNLLPTPTDDDRQYDVSSGVFMAPGHQAQLRDSIANGSTALDDRGAVPGRSPATPGR